MRGFSNRPTSWEIGKCLLTDTNFLKIVLEPEREVISLYNENFTTPKDRDPYFVEVYRCVKVDIYKDHQACGGDKYPVPNTWTEMQVVVPDLANKTRFYKYVIYNHTSCKCEFEDPTDRKLRKNLTESGECTNDFF